MSKQKNIGWGNAEKGTIFGLVNPANGGRKVNKAFATVALCMAIDPAATHVDLGEAIAALSPRYVAECRRRLDAFRQQANESTEAPVSLRLPQPSRQDTDARRAL